MRQGLVEWVLVSAFLAVAAAGAAALFGEEIRAAFGVAPPAPRAAAPAPGPFSGPPAGSPAPPP